MAPYLTLISSQAPQRQYDLREVFNALRWMVRTGAPWRMMPNDLPPWPAVYQQTQRWLAAGCFETMAHDLRVLLRLGQGRKEEPPAAMLDSQTLQSTPESGQHGGYDGHKRKKGSKLHMAVDTLGHLLALQMTPANEQDRSQVEVLAQAVQEATDPQVKLAYVAQAYTEAETAQEAPSPGTTLEVVKHHEAKRGFVLLPPRWVVEIIQS